MLFSSLRAHALLIGLLPIGAWADTAGRPSDTPRQQLGLDETANEIDIQVAYKGLLQSLVAERDHDDADLLRLADVQSAYDTLSHYDMQEEALEFVDYWADIRRLDDDSAVGQFVELQVGGSAQLRVIFVTAEKNVKLWDAFRTATKFYGQVRVGQVCHKDMLDEKGSLISSPVYSSLKVYAGSVVIFDPLTRATKITFDTTSVSAVVKRFLEGDIGSKIGRVLEYDTLALSTRCPHIKPCEWSLVIATDEAYERRRADVAKLLKEFGDACRSLQAEDIPHMACFWLRSGRSKAWTEKLAPHMAAEPNAPLVLAFRRSPQAWLVASPREALPTVNSRLELTAQEQARWATFDGVALYSVGLTRWFVKALKMEPNPTTLPAPPPPLRPGDEPKPSLLDRFETWQRTVLSCTSDKKCMMASMNALLLRAGLTTPDSTEEAKKTMLIFSAVVVVVLSSVIFYRCCGCSCAKRSANLSEDEKLRNLKLLLSVAITKPSSDARFGLGIEPSPEGGLTINSVDPSGLVGRWNETQRRDAGRVRPGDRIIEISHELNGKMVTTTSSEQMKRAFGSRQSVLTIAACRGEAEVVVLAGTISLEGIDLASDLELSDVDGGKAGSAVVKVSPKIEARNAQMLSLGCTSSQIICIGDRILVSRTPPSSHCVVAKIRFPEEVSAERFEIVVEKTGPNDRLGMQVRQFPGNPHHMEVLDVLPEGAVYRACQTSSGPRVQRGDRLIAANGNDGAEKMNAAFRESRVVLSFERWRDISGAQQFVAEPEPQQGAWPHVPFVFGAPTGSALASTGVTPFASNTTTLISQAGAHHQLQEVQAPPLSNSGASGTTMVTPPSGVVGASVRQGGNGNFLRLLAVGFIVSIAFWATTFGNKPPAVLASLPKISKHRVTLAGESLALINAIRPELHADLGVLLVVVGILLALRFISCELRTLHAPQERDVLPQLCTALAASHCIGFGSFLLLAWAGVYA